MSTIANHLLSLLHYDETTQSARISATTAGLEGVAHALHDAFGPADELLLSNVELTTSPETAPEGTETVAMTASANVFGAPRALWLELSVRRARISSLLILVPLPDTWKLSTGWPALREQDLPPLQIRGGIIVISAGIANMDKPRTIGARNVNLQDVPLLDGLQMYGRSLTRGTTDALADLLSNAQAPGISAELLPDRSRVPDYVEVRGDINALQLDAWWHVDRPTLDGLGTDVGLTWNGVGVRMKLDGSRSPLYSFLWELQHAQSEPVVLRALVLGNLPLCFTTELERPLPLTGESGALAGLLGSSASALMTETMPAAFDLVGLRYSPGRDVAVTLNARADANGDYLVKLGALELRDVQFAFAMSFANRAWTLGLDAGVQIFGVDFRARYLPNERLDAELADPEGIHVGALVEKAFGVDLPFGLDTLRLTTVIVQLRLAVGLYSVSIGLDGGVDLIPGAVKLSSIGLDVDQVGEGDLSYGLLARFDLGPVELDVRGTRASSGGWLLEGRLESDAGISLKELVDHFVHNFGVVVPDEVPDARILSVSIAYDTAARELVLEGLTDWVFSNDVPIIAGTHRVQMRVHVASNRDSGGKQAEFSLQWHLIKGSRSYDVSAHISRTQRKVALALDADANPVKLDQVFQEIGLPVDYPGHDVFDALFQLRTLSIAWTQPGGIDFAFARYVGPGVLLLEFDHATTCFDASWVPTSTDATLGVKDVLDVAGCSSAFDEIHSALDAVSLGEFAQDVEQLLTFRRLGFQVQKGTTGGMQFLAEPAHAALEACFVTAPASKGLVAGLSFKPGTSIGQFPLLSPASGLLSTLEKQVRFEPRWVVLSTAQTATVLPPAFNDAVLVPKFQRTAVGASKNTFGTAQQRVQKGLAVAGTAVFPQGSLVHEHLDLDKLDCVVSLGSSLALQAALGGTLRLDAGSDGRLVLGNPSLKLKATAAGPGVEVGGTIDLMLFGQHAAVTGWLAVDESALSAHLALDHLPSFEIASLPGVHFTTDKNPFYLDVGLQFEPEGLDLGLQGDFYIGKDPSKYRGDVTFVLEMIEEVPNPLYVKFDIDNLDLYALGEAITGIESRLHALGAAADAATNAVQGSALVPATQAASTVTYELEGVLSHLQSALSCVSFDHVSMYWADSIVPLPDGSTATPGVGIRGRSSIFGWKAYAQLDIGASAPPSIAGHLELEPLDIGGVLKLTGDGKGIRTAPARGQEVQLEKPTAGTNTNDWFIKPGGPVLHVSTRQAPFLHADVNASLFGFLNAGATADITATGMSCALHFGVGDALTLDLSCAIDSSTGLDAHGKLKFKLLGEVGPIIPGVSATKFNLDTSLEAEVDLQVSATSFRFAIRGRFHFLGASLSVPELVLTIKFASLADLGKAIWDHIKDMAEDIFSDLLLPVGKFFNQAAEAVAHVATEAAHEVAQLATETAHEVEQVTSEVSTALTKTGDEMVKAARELQGAATAVWNGAVDKAREAAASIVASAQNIAHDAIQIANQAATRVAALAQHAAAEVAKVATAVADFCSHAWDDAKDTLNRALTAVAGIVADARQIVQNLAAAAAQVEQEVQGLIDDIDAALNRIGKELASFFSNIGSTIEHTFFSFL